MMGVGGDIAWGRSVWKDYLVPKGTFAWAFTLRPFRAPPPAPPPASADVEAEAAVAQFARAG